MRQEGVVCDFDFRKLTPEKIEDGTENLKARVRQEFDKVGLLKPNEVTFENCIKV
jgi:hypothetical protein